MVKLKVKSKPKAKPKVKATKTKAKVKSKAKPKTKAKGYDRETERMLKKGIIRPHFNKIIKRGGKTYYYTEMTTGAGTHGGPLLLKKYVDKILGTE